MIDKNVKVTTTSNFDGFKILEYLEPVTAHVVVGMNIFKDFFAGLTDIFGGKSKTYQNTLSSINEQVINELRKKAYSIGANCILSLKIDNDEVSAQGKSMLMVSAIGTAAIADFSKSDSQKTCIAKKDDEDKNTKQINNEIIPEMTDNELMEKYKIKFENDKYTYKTYKYDLLKDAINYAKSQEDL